MLMLASYPGSSTEKRSLGMRLCSCLTIRSEAKSTVRIITVALIAALLACMYLPLHNLAVQTLLPSVGECCGPAKETKAAWISAEIIYQYIAILQYLVLQYTTIHLVLRIGILHVNYLSHYCAISSISSGDGLCMHN